MDKVVAMLEEARLDGDDDGNEMNDVEEVGVEKEISGDEKSEKEDEKNEFSFERPANPSPSLNAYEFTCDRFTDSLYFPGWEAVQKAFDFEWSFQMFTMFLDNAISKGTDTINAPTVTVYVDDAKTHAYMNENELDMYTVLESLARLITYEFVEEWLVETYGAPQKLARRIAREATVSIGGTTTTEGKNMFTIEVIVFDILREAKAPRILQEPLPRSEQEVQETKEAVEKRLAIQLESELPEPPPICLESQNP